MNTYNYLIPLIPITKKNSQRIVYVKSQTGGKRSIVVPSKQFKEFEAKCRPYLKPQCSTIDQQCEVTAIFYYPLNKNGTIPKRLPDLTNLLESIDDVLVKYRIVDDDNCVNIVSHDGSRVFFVHDNPRIEVSIKVIE